jgi:16S rRNA processing protein RimM
MTVGADAIHPDFITVAKIGAPFGVRGWLKIQAFTEHTENVIDYQPWFVMSADNQFTVLPIEKIDFQHGRLLAKIQGVETPEAARSYTGKLLSVPRDKLPTLSSGEFYWSDLEGLTVINRDGRVFGKVSYLLETGANDVLVVKGEKKQCAIPYLLERVIKRVDLAAKEIHVDWEPFE